MRDPIREKKRLLSFFCPAIFREELCCLSGKDFPPLEEILALFAETV